MASIVVGLDPVLLRWGGFELRWYSLTIAVAIMVGVAVGVRQMRGKGVSQDELYSLALWSILGGILGARLFHVIDRLDYYLAHPGAILAFQQGGLAIWGALAGGGLAGVIYGRVRGMPLATLADGAVIGLLSGQIIGRLGCIINGDAYGGPTTLPWGLVYTHPNALIPASLAGIPTHPYPLYEIIWDSALLVLLVTFRNRLRPEGTLSLVYLALYSVGRFLLTFVRQEAVLFWGLQQAQVIALLAITGSLVAIIYLTKRGREAQAAP